MDLTQAAHTLEQQLKPLFGNLIKVEYNSTTHRGIKVTYEREDEEAYAKRQFLEKYQDDKPHFTVQLIILPAGGDKFEVKPVSKGDVKIRRTTAPSLEAAVSSVAKWFKSNKGKLEEGTKTASMVLRVASRFE